MARDFKNGSMVFKNTARYTSKIHSFHSMNRISIGNDLKLHISSKFQIDKQVFVKFLNEKTIADCV